MSYGKSSPQLLQEIAPIAAKAGRSTVVVLCDGKPSVLGTVVRKDGLILTKFSDLHGKITCKIGTDELPATIIKKRYEHDLALLKVDAKDLTPIVWAEGDAPVPGSWLITPSADNDALGLGIVSIAVRPIADYPSMVMKNRAIVGVFLDPDPQAKNALVQNVSPGLPADKAGLKAGDVIDKVNGQATKTPKEVTQFLGKFKPGDRIVVQITRNGKPVTLKMDLVSSDRNAPKTDGANLDAAERGRRHGEQAARQFRQRLHARHGDPGHRLRRADRQPGRPGYRVEHRARRPHGDLCDSGLDASHVDAGDASEVGRGAARHASYSPLPAPSPLLPAALVAAERAAHGVDERRHAARGGVDAADNDRPRIEIADEIETELFGRVTDHHRVGERAGHQLLGKLQLFIKVCDRRGRRRRRGRTVVQCVVDGIEAWMCRHGARRAVSAASFA